jgi:TonB family protein
MLARNALLEAESALGAAKITGANPDLVADLLAEVQFKKQLAAAQSGQFDKITPFDELIAIDRRAPRWPRNAEGTVSALFTVTENGEVTDIEVINNPPRNLERAALRAIRGWRFEPYLYNGRPLPVRSSVNFNLGN